MQLSQRLPLDQCSVLVVEDDPLQAFDLEQSLGELGCAVLGPVARQADAARLLDLRRPSLALLDIALPDGHAVPLARRLTLEDVPFAVLSGQEPRLMAHPAFRGIPYVRKPYSPPEVRSVVRNLYAFDLAKSLSRVEEHIHRAWTHIGRQAQTISRLAVEGQDTRLAEELLLAFEHTRTLLEERRCQLVAAIDSQGTQMADLTKWHLLGAPPQEA